MPIYLSMYLLELCWLFVVLNSFQLYHFLLFIYCIYPCNYLCVCVSSFMCAHIAYVHMWFATSTSCSAPSVVYVLVSNDRISQKLEYIQIFFFWEEIKNQMFNPIKHTEGLNNSMQCKLSKIIPGLAIFYQKIYVLYCGMISHGHFECGDSVFDIT